MSKIAKTEFSLETILSNPVDSKTLKGFIDEALLAKGKVRMENEAIADIRNEAKDKLNIPPGLFNYLVKSQFSDSLKADGEKVEQADLALTKLYNNGIDQTSDAE
jgi:hypothetical protein